MAAETDRTNEVYNLGGGNPQSLNRLVELLGGEVVSIPKRPGEPQCTWADISKIRSQLGWEPRVSFEEGVSIILEHIDHWRDAPVWDALSIKTATENLFGLLSKEDQVVS